MTNRASLELPVGALFDALHCPVCGVKLLSPDGEGECPHLAYTYFDEVGEFTSVAPHLEEVLSAVLDDEEADEHPVDLAATKIQAKSILHLSVETSGMACGPVSSTVYLGIDFSPVGD